MWNETKGFLPNEYIEEMQGFADGSGLSFEYIAVAHIINIKSHCSVISASGPATSDNKLYFFRSLEFDGVWQDPDTGEFLDEQIIIVRKPNDGYASIYPIFPCFLYTYGGFNEKGISVGHAASASNDESYKGLSAWFRMKLVLDHASNITEGLDILNSNKTCGWNIILADGNTKESYVIEQTKNLSYVGTWNDEVESTHPCYAIDNILRRTNFFINKSLALTQRHFYNPKSLLNLLSIVVPKTRYSFIRELPILFWASYDALSRALNDEWGSINLHDLMNLVRDVFNGNNNLYFKFNKFTKNINGAHIYGIHQWATCPETGDMLICFQKEKLSSYEQPVHYFNLFNLLDS
jgi:hypothetical protein